MDPTAHADVLVTGSTGLLGAALVAALDRAGSHVVATWHRAPPPANLGAAWEALDLEDRAATRRLLERVRPRVLVHTAVATRAEDFGAIIEQASGELAEDAQALGCELVHVSSDMVFDGAHGPFAEDAPLSPITPYGAAKAGAERRVRAACPGAWIVRSSLLYALDPPDRSLAAWLSGLATGQSFALFEDEIRCPAPVSDVAAALRRLVAALLAPDARHPLPAIGDRTLHLVGPEAIDRLTFGRLVLAALGRDPALARAAKLSASGLVRPRALVLTRERTPSWLVEGIRPPRVAIAAQAARPPARAPAADRPGGR